MPIKNNDKVRIIDNGYGIHDERRISTVICKVEQLEVFMVKINGSEDVVSRRPGSIKKINDETITQDNYSTVNIGDDVLIIDNNGSWLPAKVVNKHYYVNCGGRIINKREEELQLETISFPTINKRELEHIKDDNCPICLNEYSTMPVMKTNCNHYFHKKCISEWNNPNCPICRQNILKKGGFKSGTKGALSKRVRPKTIKQKPRIKRNTKRKHNIKMLILAKGPLKKLKIIY